MDDDSVDIRFNNEVDLYRPIVELFKTQPCVFAEVPYHGKRIDLLFTGNALRVFYAVETKLVDWKKALKQAAINQLFAQRSYVALPAIKVNKFGENVLDIFYRYRVGLIAVGAKTKIIIPALRTEYLDKTHFYLVKKNLLVAQQTIKPKNLGVVIGTVKNGTRAIKVLQTGPHKRKRFI